MSQDITTARVEELFTAAADGAKAYATRIGADALVAAHYETGILRDLVRKLAVSVELQAESIASQAEEIKRLRDAAESAQATIIRQRNQIREQAGELNDLRFRLCDDDGDDQSAERSREAAAFARASGAAAALRGEA